MKPLPLALLLCLAPAGFVSAPAQPPAAPIAQTSTLVLKVERVRNSTGLVRYAVFAAPDGWPEDKSKAVRWGSLPANGGTVTFTITGLQQGTYGISVFHDENGNHKLDRDLLGRPKEGIGFGSNPRIGLSAPSWKQSSVLVAGPAVESTIGLRYP